MIRSAYEPSIRFASNCAVTCSGYRWHLSFISAQPAQPAGLRHRFGGESFMRLLTLSLALALATTSLRLAQHQVSANDDAAAKAQAILTQARAALGSEAKLKALQSLTITGTLHRVLGNRDLTGEVQLDILLPDHTLKAETLAPMPGAEMTTVEALNGAETWTDQSQGHSAGMVIIRRGPDTPQGQELAKLAVRADITRLWLGLLLNAPTSSGISYSFAGEAEAPDGKADVLRVKGANNFQANLFLDQKTHRLLMLTYQARKPRMMMNSFSGGERPSEEEMQKRMKEAQAEAAAQPLVEHQIRFSEYKDEGGIAFPHRISKAINDEISEEWELTKFKLNPGLKPEKFVKK
jgi:hypothetical protein